MPEAKIKISGDNKDFMSKLSQAKQNLKQTFQGASLGGAGSFLTASVWGAAATAVFKFGQTFASIVSEFRELRAEARSLNTTTAEMAKLADMATFSGTKLSDMTSVLTKLQDLQVRAALGSKEAATALEALGLSASDVVSMSPAEQLRTISDALNNISDPATRAAVAMQLLGKTPAEIQALGTAFEGLQLETVSKHLEQISKGWDLVAGATKQATKALIGFGAVAVFLRSLGDVGDLFGGKQTAPNVQPPTEAQKEVADKFAGTSTLPKIGEMPVDQMRRIGGFMPNAGATQAQDSEAAFAEAVNVWLPQLVELMRSVDNKTPAPTAKQ